MLIERMTRELGLSTQFIMNLARGASFEYKRYHVRKKNGGTREILHPSRRLKGLQTWLLRNVLEMWPVHAAAMAYRPGISIRSNALMHVDSRYLLRIDFQNFFPSIQRTDLDYFLDSHGSLVEGWSSGDKQVFSSLLFREGLLTIGAPTSPALSNILCFDLDSQMSEYANRQALSYTRYADDIFLSSRTKGVLQSAEDDLESILRGLDVPRNLRINRSKTQHSSKRGRRQVTGLALGSDGVIYVPRSYKRAIRALVHQYDSVDPVRRVSLAGMIAFVAGVEPSFYNSLVFKYGAEHIERVTTLPPIIDRQQMHLPKVQPSPKKSSRKSSLEVLREMLRAAGFDPD